MFGAFSFGKIIKTILPGSILTLGIVLVIEAGLRANYSAGVFAVGKTGRQGLGTVSRGHPCAGEFDSWIFSQYCSVEVL